MMQVIPGSKKTWRCSCGEWLDPYSWDWKYNGENWEHCHRTEQWHVTKLELKPNQTLGTPLPKNRNAVLRSALTKKEKQK
jgi:hypothetical protein